MTDNPHVKACIKNARNYVIAANAARDLGINNIVFLLATLALEEIGKSILIRIGEKETDQADDIEFAPLKWSEDHVKKLFWSLWTMFFGRDPELVKQFRDFQDSARTIHERRLAATYVNPNSATPLLEISAVEANKIFELADFRTTVEERSSPVPLEPTQVEEIQWFEKAIADEMFSSFIFGEQSRKQLATYGGNVRKWVPWVRQELEKLEAYNRDLAETELRRIGTAPDEAAKPKWKVTIRLVSQSHSIRTKPLTAWNKKMDTITLHRAKANEILVRFTLPKRVLMAELCNAIWHHGKVFAIALNIASKGFIWWYTPSNPKRFQDSCLDLESKAPVDLALSPHLAINWGKEVLTEAILWETLATYVYLNRLEEHERQPFLDYEQGLALLAKSDLHFNFEMNILACFYRALQGGLQQSGYWNGSGSLFDALHQLFPRAPVENLQPLIAMGDMAQGGKRPEGLTMGQCAVMKILCDQVFLHRIRRYFAVKAHGKGQDVANSE